MANKKRRIDLKADGQNGNGKRENDECVSVRTISDKYVLFMPKF